MASFFGLLLQIAIVAGVAFLIWRWWQSRSQPATAMAGGPAMREAVPSEPAPAQPSHAYASFGGAGAASQPAVVDVPIELKPEDFNAFEQLLGEILTGYGNEDVNALRTRVTPEMLTYYTEELEHNRSNGDVNKISDVKLLQGDLSEAWREGNDEYATVAMRYSLNDRLVDRNNGKLIEQMPSEVTELWTFRRDVGGQWVLSATQQSE
jgi:predicted lipid-binding transport protein (Tim44 family)